MKFKIGDIVCSTVNPDERGMVTGIVTRHRGYQYLVTWADHCENFHYEMELQAAFVAPVDRDQSG